MGCVPPKGWAHMPILKSAPEGTESALQGYPYPPAVRLGKRNFSQTEIFTFFVH